MNECDIFIAALEFDSPKQRRAYLDQTCGDNRVLRHRIEKLLASHREAGDLLEQPAMEATDMQVLSGLDALPTRETSRTSAMEPVSLDFLDPPRQKGSLGRLRQYEILEIVGRGGTGIVLRAQDTKLNRTVAVKVLAPELAFQETARRRFLREAQAAAAVRHDHVVTIYAVEKNQRPGRHSLPYLVLEFVHGYSLQQKLAREGPLETDQALRIGGQIASGLAAAHALGLIHRDIKPANILLAFETERVQITDFGLARAADDADITRTGEVTGTPQYMSPEQAQGWRIDVRSDLFSLGSVLYAMCVGRSPFWAASSMAALRRVCDHTPQPIREINPAISEELVRIIDRLLQKDPEDRFPSAQQVVDCLSACAAGVPDSRPQFIPRLQSTGRTATSAGERRNRRDLAGRRLQALMAMLIVIAIAIFVQRLPVRVGMKPPNVPGPSPTDAAPPVYPDAFVVLHAGQTTDYDDLAKAMSAATSGDTIEIRGDGPFRINVINVDRPLTIRAAAGSRPVFIPADRRHAGPVLLQATAPLVLEGLEFQWTAAADSTRPRAILQSLASLSMTNCRLVTTWNRDGLWSAGPIRVRNCEILGRDLLRMTAISWRVASGESATIDNCVLTGRIYLPFRDAELGAKSASMMLRHNTLVAATGIVLHLTTAPEARQLEPGQAKIRLLAVENAWDCRERVVVLNHSQSFQAADADAVEAYWRHCLDWQDRRNLCSSASVMMVLCRDMQPIAPPRELPEWNRFWGITEAGNLQAAIRYQGGDPYARLPTEMRPLDPGCFRLLDSPIPADGVDVHPGADLGWTGPGEAYERWKQTPHYQQWLQDSNQLP